ncbi:MAG: hypothetical protein LKF52_08230 [Butyrivibrio sp.]|nr:hypothetical protein [Butyrivibrio sp.]
MKYRNLIIDFSVMLIIILMVGFSEYFTEKEILFPEIAALSIGYLLSPKRSWKVSGPRMLLLISLCAFLGICIVRFLPGSLWLQITIAFFIGQMILLFSGTTLAPMISAIVLPVLLQSESLIYPLSAAFLTGMILLVHCLLEYLKLRPHEVFHALPLPCERDLAACLLRTGFVCLLCRILLPHGWSYLIAPPLLVAFTEMSASGSRIRKMPVRTIFLFTFCALDGTLCRAILQLMFGLPLTCAAVVSVLILLFVIHRSRMYLPPAGAIVLLSMLIPAEILPFFPVEVAAGSIVLTLISLLFFGENLEAAWLRFVTLVHRNFSHAED